MERFSAQLECTFETTVENFSAKAPKFRLTVQKKPNSRRKKAPKHSVRTKKKKNWDSCRRIFDHSLEVFRSEYMTKKTFQLEKLPSCSLAHLLNTFEISAKNIFFQTARKSSSEFEKSDNFSGKTPSRTFFCTPWMHF